MHVTKASVRSVCAVCERTLLMGEHTSRFSPDGSHYVDVCPLCTAIALEHGWLREGAAVSAALQQPVRRRRSRSLWGSLLGARDLELEPVLSDPVLLRLSEDERALVEAADLFNASQFRRTIAGVAKALGEPRASIMPISGVNAELVVTFGWDISWYQYRISPESAQQVRISRRGHDIGELEPGYKRWNAIVHDDGRIVPDVARA